MNVETINMSYISAANQHNSLHPLNHWTPSDYASDFM